MTSRSFTIPGGIPGGRGCSRSGIYTPHALFPFLDRAFAPHMLCRQPREPVRSATGANSTANPHNEGIEGEAILLVHCLTPDRTGRGLFALCSHMSTRLVSRAFESWGESAGPSSFICKEHIFGAIERAMSNSSKRKPTSNRNQQPRELISDQPQKGGWTVKAIASKSMSTIIVVIGIISGLIVFIPRVTVEPSGDISNPSSISFKVKTWGTFHYAIL